MRLQLKKGINNCSVLNDSYSNDISSLSIALDYLKQQSGNKTTTVIISNLFAGHSAAAALSYSHLYIMHINNSR
jgi:UDP-N-acetylmuramyl pentapeptide synthase